MSIRMESQQSDMVIGSCSIVRLSQNHVLASERENA
jgi:hypothetical protein